MAALAVHNLTVSYKRHPAIHHINGRFDAGSLTAVIGPNGAGKSTLLKTLAGLQTPESGRVEWLDCSAADIAYLPQQAQVDRSFPLTVLELVQLGQWRHSGWFRRMDSAAALSALAEVGMSGFEKRSIASLSVGQFQRALFARLLVQDAPVILLDEPFAALDRATTADLLAVVRHWHAQGRNVVAVIHDFEQVGRVFPRAVLLARECIAWGDTETVLAAEYQTRAERMAEAWNDSAPVCHQP